MSHSLQAGGNVALAKLAPGLSRVRVALGWRPQGQSGMEVDASAFVLAADDKVRGDEDMVFYNNPQSRDGSVRVTEPGSDAQAFELDLAAIPSEINKIAFTVTIHEGQLRRQSFSLLEAAWARVLNPADGQELCRFELPLTGKAETAMIFCQVYRHGPEWKFRAVGQGFVGGLGPLAMSFGINVAEEAAPPPAAPVSSLPPAPPPASNEHGVRLEKRIISLEKKDPKLVSLVKNAGVQLAKHGLESHQARVALCLDISGSMHGLYRKGSIDELVRRVLALGFRFDDDGEIDVFLFGANAHQAGTVNAENYKTFVSDMQRRYPLEGGTHYGKVIEMVREYYHRRPGFGQVPVYVMFTTDGDTQDRATTEREMMDASREAIFWQFMAIGEAPGGRKGFFSRLLSPDFGFLNHLDTMSGRFLDNANFFLVRDPAEPSDEQLYDMMMAEYPGWLKQAREKGVLR